MYGNFLSNVLCNMMLGVFYHKIWKSYIYNAFLHKARCYQKITNLKVTDKQTRFVKPLKMQILSVNLLILQHICKSKIPLRH